MNINNRVFGYWPSSIFSILSNSAARVDWGGEVLNYNSGGQHTTTQMGSGHFADEGSGKASFFKNLQVIDALQILRGPRNPTTFMTKPECYNIIDYGGLFYFGGPGRNPKCPWSFRLSFQNKEERGKYNKRGIIFFSFPCYTNCTYKPYVI